MRGVCDTDPLSSFDRAAGAHLGELLPAQVLRLPLRMPNFDGYLDWHANFEADPANSWLRRQLLAAAKG